MIEFAKEESIAQVEKKASCLNKMGEEEKEYGFLQRMWAGMCTWAVRVASNAAYKFARQANSNGGSIPVGHFRQASKIVDMTDIKVIAKDTEDGDIRKNPDLYEKPEQTYCYGADSLAITDEIERSFNVKSAVVPKPHLNKDVTVYLVTYAGADESQSRNAYLAAHPEDLRCKIECTVLSNPWVKENKEKEVQTEVKEKLNAEAYAAEEKREAPKDKAV
jgi:hypothetical protein